MYRVYEWDPEFVGPDPIPRLSLKLEQVDKNLKLSGHKILIYFLICTPARFLSLKSVEICLENKSEWYRYRIKATTERYIPDKNGPSPKNLWII